MDNPLSLPKGLIIEAHGDAQKAQHFAGLLHSDKNTDILGVEHAEVRARGAPGRPCAPDAKGQTRCLPVITPYTYFTSSWFFGIIFLIPIRLWISLRGSCLRTSPSSLP